MTTPSSFEGTGLSIGIHMPLVQGGAYLYDVSKEVEKYTHSLAASGGFLSASFSINGEKDYLEDWFQHGLGRHIQVHNPAGKIIWEGFVNQIDLDFGGMTSTRGPLVNIANRVSVVYTPIIDETTDPPTTGSTTETTIVENLDSQEIYGIWEKVVSAGNLRPADAEYTRDLYLIENSYPDNSVALSIGGVTNVASVTMQCRGYVDWLGYSYNYSASPQSTINTDVKVKRVLAADPNDLFSTDYSDIDYVGAIIQEFEGENRTVLTIIDEMVALGGIASDRTTFCVYANRKCYYKIIPSKVEYHYYIADSVQLVEYAEGGLIQPWDVQAGKWARIPDFMSGMGGIYNNPREDPRVFFVEQVDFTAPYSLSVSGGKARKLAQLLANLGLAGA